jgi:hypothetical protein
MPAIRDATSSAIVHMVSVRGCLWTLALCACANSTASGSHDAAVDGALTDATVDSPGGDAALDAIPQAIVRIEEVYVDQSAMGAAYEYIEISGTPGGSLDGLSVRVIASAGTSGAKHTYALSTTAGTIMPADGRWVIGGILATGTDRTLTTSSGGDDWNLDGTAGAIQLLRASASTPDLVDVLGYGAPVTPAMSLGPPTATADGTHEALPSSTRSMGRLTGAPDTGSNMADFCGQTQSPGSANGACL